MSIAFYHGTTETGGRIWLQAGAVGVGRMTFPNFREGGTIAKNSGPFPFWMGSVPGLDAAGVDAIFFDFIVDGPPADAQHLGGLFLNPAGLFQGPEDGVLFALF